MGARASNFPPNFRRSPTDKKTNGGGIPPRRWRVGKDDWKYDEDAWDEMADEEKPAAPPAEKQCAQCLHWVDREAIYCPWCGKALGEKDRRADSSSKRPTG